MWRGYVEALKLYFNVISKEWESQGYEHNLGYYGIEGEIEYPSWLGNEEFHKSHRSNLLRKESSFYEKYDWDVPNDLDYIWPS